MKISKLHINQFRHLENLDFDFTYQSGERKGQPLDKICFIGQSATGKTGLLELIYNDIQNIINIELDENNNIFSKSGKNFSNIEFELENQNIKTKINNSIIDFENGALEIYVENNKLNDSKKEEASIHHLFNQNNINEKIHFIKSDILSNQNIQIFGEKTAFLIEKYKQFLHSKNNVFSENFVFGENTDDLTWASLLNDNIVYNQEFFQFASEIINSGKILDNSTQKRIDDWKFKNEDPLKFFSEKFNLILDKINLEVDFVNKINIIPLKNKITGENIPIENTSTGTKQLLLTAVALNKIPTKDSIILIDEPERSLYPDMQMDLMDHYQRLAPEAQFIVATHSPFIAASFEADERFILHFDEEGKVAVRRGSSPIGDDPNDMLYNDFGVNYYNKKVQEKFKEYIELLDKVKTEKDIDLKKKYILEASKIGNHYNFILDEKNQERLQ